MQKKLAIVGQAPNSNGLGAQGHLMGKFGERLAELLGISLEDYEHRVWRYNLINYYPGSDGKGDHFPKAEAAKSAQIFSESFAEMNNDVLLLGKNVATSFGFKKAQFFESFEVGNSTYHIIPHPSGINRWWNSPDNREKAENYLKKLAKRVIF